MRTVSFFNDRIHRRTHGRRCRQVQWLKSLLGGAKVYIDDDGIIYDASLNQTNIGGNNNKVDRFQSRHHGRLTDNGPVLPSPVASQRRQ